MTETRIYLAFVVALIFVGVVVYLTNEKARKFEQAQPQTQAVAVKEKREEGMDLGAVLPVLKGSWIAPDGKSEATPEYKGKVVLVDVWSTFCGPCVASIPFNNKFVGEYGPKGLVFIGIAPQPKGMLLDFKSKREIAYPLLASSEEDIDAFNVKLFPSTFLFGKDGKLVWQGHLLERNGKLDADFDAALQAALTAEVNAVSLPPEFEKLVEKAKENAAKIPASEDQLGLKLGAGIPELKGAWLAADGKAPDLKGKIVLLDLWSTGCGPCVAGIAYNNALNDMYQSRGLVLVGATPEEKAKIERFEKTTEFRYPVLCDCDGLFKFLEIKEIPATFLFDREGKLVWKGGALETLEVPDAGFLKALEEVVGRK